MGWETTWTALSARIAGVYETAMFLTSTVHSTNSDFHGIINSAVLPNCRGIFAELEKIRSEHGSELPPLAAAALDRFLSTYRESFARGVDRVGGWTGLQLVIGALTSFRAEFAYLLSDAEAVARSLTLRAFIHLQRSIVADESFAARWRLAFSINERTCEKLGAVHLLAHGIWAFKADATGERTDLVLGERLLINDDVRSSAQALVLTEWKVVRDPGDAQAQADQALKQARRYSAGVLAGFELASTRYLVLVSQDHLPVPGDVADGEVKFRHINIAVEPSKPSTR